MEQIRLRESQQFWNRCEAAFTSVWFGDDWFFEGLFMRWFGASDPDNQPTSGVFKLTSVSGVMASWADCIDATTQFALGRGVLPLGVAVLLQVVFLACSLVCLAIAKSSWDIAQPRHRSRVAVAVADDFIKIGFVERGCSYWFAFVFGGLAYVLMFAFVGGARLALCHSSIFVLRQYERQALGAIDVLDWLIVCFGAYGVEAMCLSVTTKPVTSRACSCSRLQ